MGTDDAATALPALSAHSARARRGWKSDAIVVRTVDFAETSQVVHLVTPEHGLVAALAKGAHGKKSAFQGGIPLGVLGEAELHARRGAELELLRSFRVTDGLRGLRDDLGRFAAGSYVLGLVRLLSRPALGNEALFLAAVTSLKAISVAPGAGAPPGNGTRGPSARAARRSIPSSPPSPSSPAATVLPTWIAVFEARALAATGHRPHLNSCVLCGESLPGVAPVVFAPAAGGVAHRRCAVGSPAAGSGHAGPVRSMSLADRAALERLYTDRIPSFASDPLSPADARSVRAVHDLFLPYVLDREPEGLRAIPRV